MNPLDVLGKIWGGVTGGIGAVVDAVKHAVRWITSLAVTIFDLVGGAWDWMVNGVGWLGDNVIGLAARVLHLLEWIALHAIPEGLAWLWGKAVRFARAAVHTATRILEHAIRTARDFVLGVVRKLEGWAKAAVRWLTRIAGEAWTFVEKIGKRVADLVLHPERLVKWILGALVLPLVRWFIEASAWLLVWLLRSFVRESAAFAHTLEDVLSRII